MAIKSSENIVRFTIKAVGPARTEEQVRQDVQAALQEALKIYKAQTKKTIRAEAEPEGAFTGIELAALWLLKTLAGGAVGAAGAAGGKKLYGLFAKSLKKRNLDPGKPSTVKPTVKGKDGKKKS